MAKMLGADHDFKMLTRQALVLLESVSQTIWNHSSAVYGENANDFREAKQLIVDICFKAESKGFHAN
ncbi:hypothetical protein [Paraburkholderia sp. RL17-337-BIB-A]|uniref:hypothetical protein n=1 Tax=Paraburkholderia sp. RL17-337-BIB-A TaxID=3031636 RepID=UPI0038B72E23